MSNEPSFIQYSILSNQPWLTHFTTTRFGGVSCGSYDSLNLGLTSGDSDSNIKENQRRVCKEHGIADTYLYFPIQTHGTKTLVIDTEFLTQSVASQQQALQGVDALVTNIPGVCIGVATADCVPLILVDSVSRAVGVVHAGWRGTAQRIVQATLEQMKTLFSTDTANVIAVIAPAISRKNYEVGDELLTAFQEAEIGTNLIFERNIDTGQLHLDLPMENRRQLIEMGVRPQNIECSEICTAASTATFFSARKLGLKSGRFATCAMIRKSE